MSSLKTNEPSRRLVAYCSLVGTTQLHLRNPFVIAAWSVAFPGMGHLLLSKYIRGFILLIWEVIINYKANVNLLMLYSFIGDFDQAKQIVDIRWLSLYIPTYIFAIWDSYRTTVDINNVCVLATRENAEIKTFKIGAFGINYLDKRKPWVSAIWSMLIPGSGQLYIHRIIIGAFLMSLWMFICYHANFFTSLHYTVLGDFEQAKSVLDMHWFLNIPSIYFFAVYDAYTNTVENNKLFDREQSNFLKEQYQYSNFILPLKKNIRGGQMYIVSTFEHSVYVELAVTALELKGIKKEKIMAVSMKKKGEQRMLFDSIHSSDGLSLLDLPAILGVIFGVFGSIYGFVLKWGPLFWGLISIFIGAMIGLIIKLIVTKKYSKRQNDKAGAEVVIIIECSESQLEMVEEMLWTNKALGVSELDLENT